MVLGPIFSGEFDELFRSFQRIVDLLRLAEKKRVSFSLHHQARALNLSSDANHRVQLDFLKEVGDTRSPERPDTLRYGPAQARIVLHASMDDLLALNRVARVQSDDSFFRQQAPIGFVEVVRTVKKDSRAKSMLESSGTSSEITSHAHAHQCQIVTVYIRPSQDVVHGRGYHRLPVISEGKLLFANRRTLSRTVEGQTVILPPSCASRAEIEKFLKTRIQSTVEDQCGTRRARIVHFVEISRQRGALVRDFHRLPGWPRELRGFGIRLS